MRFRFRLARIFIILRSGNGIGNRLLAENLFENRLKRREKRLVQMEFPLRVFGFAFCLQQADFREVFQRALRLVVVAFDVFLRELPQIPA
jgi:hypothetical protein